MTQNSARLTIASIAPLCRHLAALDAKAAGATRAGTTRLFGDAVVVRDQCNFGEKFISPWIPPTVASPGCGGGSTGNTIGVYWAARAVAAARRRPLVWLRACPTALDVNVEGWLPDVVPAPEQSSPHNDTAAHLLTVETPLRSTLRALTDYDSNTSSNSSSSWSFTPWTGEDGIAGAAAKKLSSHHNNGYADATSASICAGNDRWFHTARGPWLGILPRLRVEMAAGLAAAYASADANALGSALGGQDNAFDDTALDDVAIHMRLGDTLQLGLHQVVQSIA